MNVEFWSVYNKNTGLKICECLQEKDAKMMLYFDHMNRELRKNQVILDQVVDVKYTTDGQLSGSNNSYKSNNILNENTDVLIDLS